MNIDYDMSQIMNSQDMPVMATIEQIPQIQPIEWPIDKFLVSTLYFN